ncbi:MAG: ABC transporter substrate-binding protein [Roseburia sp.]|nr:ABC transporter substrate-binding protein [Roseburia sp.]
MNRDKKTSFLIRICCIMGVGILCGCGRESLGAAGKSSTDTGYREEHYEWAETGFAQADDVPEEALLFLSDYERLDFEPPEETEAELHYQAVGENVFFLLDIYYSKEEALYYLRNSDKPSESLLLSPVDWGIGNGSIQGMAVQDEKKLVFWVGSDYQKSGLDGAYQHYYAVYTDDTGRLLEKVDIIETLKEYRIWEDSGYAGGVSCCDGEGNLYLCDDKNKEIYVVNREGRLVLKSSYPAGEEGDSLQAFRASEGEVVFAYQAGNQTELFCLNTEKDGKKLLAVEKFSEVCQWYGLKGHMLYYATDKELIRWNVATGERKIIVNLQENGVTNVYGSFLAETSDGIRMLFSERKECYALTFSEEEPQTKEQFVFCNIYGKDSFLEGRLAEFSRKNQMYTISYRDAADEDSAGKVLMEMANGAGPDMLFVSQEDMEKLQDVHALADLGQLLEDRTKEVLLPGVVEMGSFEGGIYGLPLYISVETVASSRKYWPKDSWTTAEIIELLEEQTALQGIYLDYFGQDSYFYNMYFLIGANLENSVFIKGAQGFDCELFRSVLRTVKDRTSESGYAGEILEAVGQGAYLGQQYPVFDMASFGTMYKRIGQDGFMAGYPVDTGRGNFIERSGMIVVNQSAAEKEGLYELLQYLYGVESQALLERKISVRLDIPERLVEYDEEENAYYWNRANGYRTLLPRKEDGSSYLEEYVAFLKGVTSRSAHSDELFDIVMEEADSYFYSDKDMEEVIEVIQRRVNLYVSEKER